MARVLVAEDHAATRLLVAGILEMDGHEVVIAKNGQDAWRALSTRQFDVALLDWLMPHMDGLQVCRAVRQGETDGYLYVILVTAKGQTGDLVTGLEAGADDYLVKPFSPAELRARLRAGERVIRLQQKLREESRKSAELALTDELTGLLNRRAILQRIEEESDRTVREGRPLSVILADVDGFKEVNDTHGHGVGDEVLREFARRVRRGVRSYDPVARIGGDEFLTVLSGVPALQASRISERLRTLIADAPFDGGIGGALNITASFGVTDSALPTTANSLIKAADSALYTAKRAGGNRVMLPPASETQSASQPGAVAADQRARLSCSEQRE